jgi:hypothetical protein
VEDAARILEEHIAALDRSTAETPVRNEPHPRD